MSEDKIAQEVGYLIFAFNTLEGTLDTVLFEILHPRTNEFGKIVTEGSSFSRKLSLLQRLYEHYFEITEKETAKTELKELLGRIKSANTTRNKVVHAAWEDYFYSELDEKVRTRWKFSKGRIKEQTITDSPQLIIKAKEEMEILDELLYNFHEKYFYN